MQDLVEIQELEEWMKEILDTNKVKYDENEVEWGITSDTAGISTNAINNNAGKNAQLRNTHIVFLEEGNSNAGLQHIYQGHQNDFKNKYGVDSKEEISDFIKNTMTNYDPVKVTSGRRGGIDVVYEVSSGDYLHVTIGSNGFIVTAFPKSTMI